MKTLAKAGLYAALILIIGFAIDSLLQNFFGKKQGLFGIIVVVISMFMGIFVDKYVTHIGRIIRTEEDHPAGEMVKKLANKKIRLTRSSL